MILCVQAAYSSYDPWTFCVSMLLTVAIGPWTFCACRLLTVAIGPWTFCVSMLLTVAIGPWTFCACRLLTVAIGPWTFCVSMLLTVAIGPWTFCACVYWHSLMQNRPLPVFEKVVLDEWYPCIHPPKTGGFHRRGTPSWCY